MTNKNGIILSALILLTIFHDFLFIALYGTPLYLFAIWKDLIVVYFILFLFLSTMKETLIKYKLNKNKYLYLKIVLIFIIIGLFSFNNGLIQNINNFRYYILLFFFSLVLGKFLALDEKINFLYFKRTFIISLILVIIYGYYQYLTISMPDDFWYWNHFVSLGFELKEWDVIRNGKPRVASFFTSSIEFSFFLVICYAFVLSNFYLESRYNIIKMFLYLFLLINILFSIYISTVRTGIIAAVGITTILIILIFIKNNRKRLIISYLIFLSMVISTFIYIMSGGTDDLSALGRVIQWKEFFELIQKNIFLGLGISEIGPLGNYWFDSFFINLFLSFGIFFGFYFLLYYIKIYKSIVLNISNKQYKYNRLIDLQIFLLFPVMLYLFFFQSFGKSIVLFLFFSFFASSIEIMKIINLEKKRNK